MLALHLGRLGKGGAQVVIVMAVHPDGVPAEGGELVIQGIGGHDVGGAAVDLEAVDVDDGAQVVQLVLGGGHEGLPNLALLNLAVPHQGVHPVVPAVHLPRQGHAHGGGDALAQGAGGHVHPGDVHLRVAGHGTVNAAEHLQFLLREEAPEGQIGVEGGGAVSLGEDKAVPGRVGGVGGVDAQHLLVQESHDLHGGEGTSDVAGGRAIDHFHPQQTAPGRGESQLVVV